MEGTIRKLEEQFNKALFNMMQSHLEHSEVCSATAADVIGVKSNVLFNQGAVHVFEQIVAQIAGHLSRLQFDIRCANTFARGSDRQAANPFQFIGGDRARPAALPS